MQHSEISFVPLLVVIALVFIVPLVLSRLKKLAVPIIVGEIIAGIIVGRSGLNLIGESTVLEILSDLGFAYLMFLSGLEINFGAVLNNGMQASMSRVRRIMTNPLAIGCGMFLLTFLAAAGAGIGLQAQGLVDDPWIIALILSTTSLGVMVPVLKERGLTERRSGQIILLASLVADFASILLISIYVVFRSQGLTPDILLVLVLFAAFVAVYRLATLSRRHFPAARLLERLSSATAQIRMRGSFALALVFIALQRPWELKTFWAPS